MKAILLKDFNNSLLTLEDIPQPLLKPGQVLIKMVAAPINPSDLVFLRNLYGIKKKLPVVPGFEGAGTVVSSSAGLYGRWLVGKRVACHAPEDGDGTWAEYMAVDALSVVPLLKKVTLEQGASLLVNPLTAWMLLDLAQCDGQTGVVQTAAASALGRMIERLARRRMMRTINIVRRREAVEMLKQSGAIHVLDSTGAGFEAQLRVLCQTHSVRMALDSVGGDLATRILNAMPTHSTVVQFGALSGKSCDVPPSALIFEQKSVRGFWVSKEFPKLSFWKRMRLAHGAQKLLATDLATSVQARFPLEKVNEAIALYKEKRAEGKVLLTFPQ